MNKIYLEGAMAEQRYAARTDNPYPYGTDDHRAWDNGWCDREMGRRYPEYSLRTIKGGSVLVTWINERGGLDSRHYTADRGRVYELTEKCVLVPAFNGLKIEAGETLEQAVRRGLLGAHGDGFGTDVDFILLIALVLGLLVAVCVKAGAT